MYFIGMPHLTLEDKWVLKSKQWGVRVASQESWSRIWFKNNYWWKGWPKKLIKVCLLAREGGIFLRKYILEVCAIAW